MIYFFPLAMLKEGNFLAAAVRKREKPRVRPVNIVEGFVSWTSAFQRTSEPAPIWYRGVNAFCKNRENIEATFCNRCERIHELPVVLGLH